MTPLPVSIVIPARNRNAVLQTAASSYLNQGCKELVIVDDASDPPLEPISSGAVTSVRWIRFDRRVRQPAARMAGARAATQPYIFFGEDDAFLTEGCIASLFRFVAEGEFDIAAPQLITIKSFSDEGERVPDARSVSRASEIVDYRFVQIDYSCRPRVPIQVPWLHAMGLMRRETVLQLGFDSGYRGNSYREETDFYLRAHAAGVRLAFVPGPPAYHYKGPLLTNGWREASQALVTEFWVARNNLRFLRKNQAELKQVGVMVQPIAGTLALVARRIRWYGRRSWLKISHRDSAPASVPL